ncbi:MAG: ATP-binding protein [Bacteroidota bacterium]
MLEVNLYAINNNEIKSYKDGALTSQNNASSRGACCSKITIPSNDTIDFLLQLELGRSNNGQIQNVRFAPFLVNEKIFVDLKQEYLYSNIPILLTLIVFVAICFIISTTNFIHFYLNKDKAYVFYALFLLSISFYYLYHLEVYFLRVERFFFFKYLGVYALSMGKLLFFCIVLSQILFYRHFMQSPIFYKNYDKKLMFGLIAILLMLIPILIQSIFFDPLNFFFYRLCLLGIVFPYMLFLIINLYRLKNRLFHIVATGSLILLFSSIIGFAVPFIVEVLGVKNSYSLINTLTPAIIGSLIEIMFFSAALGYRTNLLNEENQLLQEKEKFTALKTQFYTNITHEFRTPITVIQGLTDKIASKKYQTDLAIIKNNSKRLLHLVNQFLSLSKLESGVMKVNLQQADVVAYLRYLKSSIASLAAQKEVALHFESEQEQIFLDFDAEKIQYIFINLLSNAIKFTEAGGAVEVKVQQAGERLQIAVADTGIGLSATDQAHIFKRFYQSKDERAKGMEGSGIGLAVCKEMAELLGGTITVQSQLNEGSTFTVTLPITRNAPSAVLPTGEDKVFTSTSPLKQGLEIANLLASAPATLLLVEDHADVLYLLTQQLKGKYRLMTATNGKEGIALASEQLPDLIISDVMMPEMDGYEFCEALKKNEATQHIPVILLTAKADQASKIEGLQYGADAYLSKPFDETELFVRIEKLLEKQKLLQQYYQNKYLATAQIPDVLEIVQEDPLIQQCVELIEANLQAKWTAQLLAQKMNIGHHTLRRKITQLSSYSPTIFIRRLRLKRAYELIVSTKKAISSIAYEVGFNSPNELSKYFKEVFGFPPSDLRD